MYLSIGADGAQQQLIRRREGAGDSTQDVLPDGVVIEVLAEIIRGNRVQIDQSALLKTHAIRSHLRKTAKGKKGYSPACTNEWVREVCDKRRVKCGECPNQAFLAVTADTVLDHLQGRHVIGVYPMLKDETCWFLAADFDKEAWREDVLAFSETCRRIGISYAIERSRSGNGAHVWFFFDSPVAAATAGKMGSYLLTETMTRRHQLNMHPMTGSSQTRTPRQTVAPAT